MSAEGSADQDFKDHFSGHAADYASHRPSYPSDLFVYLAAAAPARALAWDCATGNGQSAVALADHFDRVVATDASGDQLAMARMHERVDYRREPAEATTLGEESCDLIAVAQAAHWFDLERFYAEVRRVARPGGVLALWTYDLLRVTPRIDRQIDHLRGETVGAYWPAERCWVDARYADLPFPFADVERPRYRMSRQWTVDQALAYLGTWSAVQRFIADRGHDPLRAVAGPMRDAWGDGTRRVEWTLTVLVGRIS